MKIHITNLYGMAENSTALIAQNDVTKIMMPQGYRELGFYFYDIYSDSTRELETRLDGIMASVGYGDIVVYQSPSWNGREFDQLFIEKCKILNVKLITFVHDVPPLMFADSNYYLLPEYIDMYNQSDVLILPSEKMKKKLLEEGLKVEKVITQDMWDHPFNDFLYQPQFEKKLFFAGSIERFPHLQSWDYDLPLHIFSDSNYDTEQLYFEGWKSDSEMMLTLSRGGFGLVWGTQENPLDEPEYYQLNASHKLSSYLAAGIPVIVPAYLTMADVVKNKGLGFVVSTMAEAVKVVENCSLEEYQQMVEKIKMTSFLIRQGFFTKSALTQAIMKLDDDILE